MEDKIDVIYSQLKQREHENDVLCDELAGYKKASDYETIFNNNLVDMLRNRLRITKPNQPDSTNIVISNKEWDQIEQLIKRHAPKYYELTEVKHSITQSEQHICTLIFLNFKNDEISFLLGVTPQRVSRVKSKLCMQFFNSDETRRFRDLLMESL